MHNSITRGRVALLAAFLLFCATALFGADKKTTTYDINTLKGKVASVNGTAGLQIRFSAFIEEEANDDADSLLSNFESVDPSEGTTTSFTDGQVTVNLDRLDAPQNETAIAVDPNNPSRVVGGANDYVTGTWSCFLGSTPCSALGDGYSGTYYSNDSGATWCCNSSDPAHIGTLIPGVEHLVGGQYDAGGDPAVAFDSSGNVFYAGLGFNRTSAPNTVTVNKGTFDGAGALTWGAPAFINRTTAPSTLNDKEWIAADHSTSSPYRDNVYVSWTRFLFNPVHGSYEQSPIMFVRSTDGGSSFSSPQTVGAPVIYSQGSRPAVGPDGTVYVVWDGSTRLATHDSIWIVKSTDGGATFAKPVAISEIQDVIPIANTAFRVNSYPSIDVAPNGDIYVAWTSQQSNAGGLCATRTNTNCHVVAMWSKSSDHGAHWSAPQAVFPTLDASTRNAVGYPVNQTAGTFNAPADRPVDTIWPSIAISPTGRVHMSAYAADVVSPRCSTNATTGVTTCANNALLNFYVTDGNTVTKTSDHNIDTRRDGFGGGFMGDYTGLAVGSDNVYHAFWTNTGLVQPVQWFFGSGPFPSGTLGATADVVTARGSF